MASLKTAVTDGTELVTITYALYRLELTITKESNKAAAIETLRKEVKAKGVSMGPSLAAQAAKLAAA